MGTGTRRDRPLAIAGSDRGLGCPVVVPRVVLAVLAAVAVLTFAHHAGDDTTSAASADGAQVAAAPVVPAAPGGVVAAGQAAPVPVRASGDGFLVLDRARPAVGIGAQVTYTVEVEPALRAEAPALQDQVALVLDDTRHGWAAQQALQQVTDPAGARVRVLLALPATVDRLCAQAGFTTSGVLSCWNGRFAALNVMRWRQAAAGFESVSQYRSYQINHEFGHGLGHLHEYCPGPGALAPVMMQQTKGLLGCRPNPWPVP